MTEMTVKFREVFSKRVKDMDFSYKIEKDIDEE